MISSSGRYCDGSDWEEQEEEQGSTEEEPHSRTDLEEAHYSADNLYVVSNIVRQIGSSPFLKHVMRRYRYDKADETAEPPLHISKPFIDVYWRRFHKRRKETARPGAN